MKQVSQLTTELAWGLTGQQLMVLAHENTVHGKRLCDFVQGFIFLAVPHRGADIATTADMLANIANCIPGLRLGSNLTKSLRAKSKELWDLADSWKERGAGTRLIRTFLEEKEMFKHLVRDPYTLTPTRRPLSARHHQPFLFPLIT